MEIHNIKPIFNSNSKILILGSFPSVKSRQEEFFYAHKQNRFWKVLSRVLNQQEPISIEEKKAFLLKNKIALWDVISSCEIFGSSDSSIKKVKPNNLSIVLNNSQVNKIFVNGKTALKYYNKYILDAIKTEAECLPSTSPANATFSLEKLVLHWQQILKFL